MENENGQNAIVDYNGVCLICGSFDGMIVKGNDNRHRVICRCINCQGWYTPLPFAGYEDLESAQDWNKGYEALTKANPEAGLTFGQYIFGK